MVRKNTNNSGYQKLKQDIAGNKPSGLYLFWGEEGYLREHYLGELKKLLLPEGLEEFNYKRFEGKNLDLSLVEEAVGTLPVFCKRRVVEVRDFDFYRAAANKRDKLQEIIDDLPEHCCLIFVFTDPGFRPDTRVKLHTTLKNTGVPVEFKKQEQSDLINWIRRRFAAMDKEIDRSDAEYLIHLCGGLMTGLISETEKIGAFAGGKKVTRQDIDAVATPVLDAVVFKMTDSLSRKDFEASAKILGELLQMRENPIMILSVIGKQMRGVYSARLAMENNLDSEYLKELWSMRSAYPARLMMDSARKLSTHWCREAVIMCARTDFQMKSTGRDGETLLKELLINLAAGDIQYGQGK